MYLKKYRGIIFLIALFVFSGPITATHSLASNRPIEEKAETTSKNQKLKNVKILAKGEQLQVLLHLKRILPVIRQEYLVLKHSLMLFLN